MDTTAAASLESNFRHAVAGLIEQGYSEDDLADLLADSVAWAKEIH